jgi:hypothetical protein
MPSGLRSLVHHLTSSSASALLRAARYKERTGVTGHSSFDSSRWSVAETNDLVTTVLRWRTWTWLTAIGAVGPTILYASPFGPARDLAHASLLLLGYPVWFLFSCVSLAPGIVLVKRFELNPWWVLPFTAVLFQLLIGAVAHWPPTRWWPLGVVGQTPVPSAYVFSIPIEAWYGYVYSLWPAAFTALIAALSLLTARHFLCLNNSPKGSSDA